MIANPRFWTALSVCWFGLVGFNEVYAQLGDDISTRVTREGTIRIADSHDIDSKDTVGVSYFDSPIEVNVIDSTNRTIESVPCAPTKKPTPGPTPYKDVYYDNDYSYLQDGPDAYGSLGDRLKQNSVFGIGCLDIGGQYRMRGHWEQNMRGLGLTGRDDSFLLHRTRIFANLTLGSNFRLFAEMIDAESNNEQFAPRPIEVNRTDMQNLFLDARLMGNEYGEVTARVGRQEILLGSQRVITPLDWANTRRNYEGARVTWEIDNLKVDGFWYNPVRTNANQFDSPDRDAEWWGIYSTIGGTTGQNLDAYFLQLDGRNNTGLFNYSTLGTRWYGDNEGTLWDVEGGYQFGDNANGSDHSAGFATFGLGQKLPVSCWEPTLWAYYDWASGDQATGQGNGFHHQFPLAHKYLGFMDLFGRRNIEDANLLFTMKPADNVKLLLWYHYFFLESQTDTPYNINMTAFNGGNAPGSAYLGQEIDFLVDYSISTRQKLVLGYSHFFAGSYYRTTAGVPHQGDADFFYSQWSIDF